MHKGAYYQKIPISLFLWEFRQFWIESVSVVIDKGMDVHICKTFSIDLIFLRVVHFIKFFVYFIHTLSFIIYSIVR